MNLPNKITLVRILMIPLIMVVMLLAKINPENNFLAQEIIINNVTWANIIALIIFTIAALTDALDGYIARSRGLTTNLGKFLDPLADKLLVMVAMLVLMEEKRISGWVVAIILTREFAVTGLRAIAATNGEVIAASSLGKLKTISQMAMIGILFLNNFPFSLISKVTIPFDLILVLITVGLTILSGIDYFIKNKNVLKNK